MQDYFLKCSVENCEVEARSLGMCKSHYAMFSRYGRLEKVKSGIKIVHPLYGMWNKRKQKEGNFVKEWLDFDTFTKAVGERPENHFLARLDETKPCGPDNWEWRKIKVQKLDNETDQEYRLRQRAKYRLENPLAARRSNYRTNFNLTLEEVEEKLKSQNNVCSICKKPETATYKNTGKIRTLALDHNHKTKKIRDFLCTRCNNVLGRIEEDTNLLSEMILYLRRHDN